MWICEGRIYYLKQSAPHRLAKIDEDEHTNYNENDLDEDFETTFKGGSSNGYSTPFRDKNGTTSTCEQYTHYYYRPKELEDINLVEFLAEYKVWMKPPPKKDTDEKEPVANQTRGRKKNIRLEFMEGHPWKDSHHVVMRSKHVVVMRAGRSRPPYPTKYKNESDQHFNNRVQEFLNYFATLLIPVC